MRGFRADGLHPRRAGGRRAAGPALRGHRAGPLHLLERREGLDAVPAQSADHADHRPQDPRGNLIAATSGRGLWILDDLALIRQYRADARASRSSARRTPTWSNSGSELNESKDDFTGADPTRGVNPATGIVLYYRLPKLEKTDVVALEVRDSAGKLVRRFSSKKDTTFKKWDGGPPAEPVLPAGHGTQPVRLGPAVSDHGGSSGRLLSRRATGDTRRRRGRIDSPSRWERRTTTTDAEILAEPAVSDGCRHVRRVSCQFMSGMERELTHDARDRQPAARDAGATGVGPRGPSAGGQVRRHQEATGRRSWPSSRRGTRT